MAVVYDSFYRVRKCRSKVLTGSPSWLQELLDCWNLFCVSFDSANFLLVFSLCSFVSGGGRMLLFGLNHCSFSVLYHLKTQGLSSG